MSGTAIATVAPHYATAFQNGVAAADPWSSPRRPARRPCDAAGARRAVERTAFFACLALDRPDLRCPVAAGSAWPGRDSEAFAGSAPWPAAGITLWRSDQ